MKRKILEIFLCMLKQSGLSESFWAEAATTSAYMINRTPSSMIDNNIPEKRLKKKPGYKHLRMFGSIVCVHVNQGKLKPRALNELFIRYTPGVKGYKVWLLGQKKCVISRNALFDEHVIYKDMLGLGTTIKSTET